MKRLLKQALWDASPTLFGFVTKPRQGQTFSIGIYAGQCPLSLMNPKSVKNPVLTHEDVTDVPAAFVADPFMVRNEDQWYLFFEVLNKATGLGQIALATSQDGYAWTYARSVLNEPFHLAYPYVFRHNGDFYMVPDSPDQGVRLYRAIDFPNRWEWVDTLVEGGRFSDSSIFEFDGTWWMLTAWSLDQSDSKSLRLFFADDPTGPWLEHVQSPVHAAHVSRTRPAGRVVVRNGIPMRFAQDGLPEYGSRVRAFEITRLSRLVYHEREVRSKKPVLQGSGRGWNAGGMHHMDAHELLDGTWIACVDGWYART